MTDLTYKKSCTMFEIVIIATSALEMVLVTLRKRQ